MRPTALQVVPWPVTVWSDLDPSNPRRLKGDPTSMDSLMSNPANFATAPAFKAAAGAAEVAKIRSEVP